MFARADVRVAVFSFVRNFRAWETSLATKSTIFWLAISK